jgi:hypothetical protein
LNKGNGGGPTSLNFTYRKAVINKINEENNAFLNKLQAIKSTVPNVRSLERVHENVIKLAVLFWCSLITIKVLPQTMLMAKND